MNTIRTAAAVALALAAASSFAQSADQNGWQFRGEAGWVQEGSVATGAQAEQTFGAPLSGYRWVSGSNAHWERVAPGATSAAAVGADGVTGAAPVPHTPQRDDRPADLPYPQGRLVTGG